MKRLFFCNMDILHIWPHVFVTNSAVQRLLWLARSSCMYRCRGGLQLPYHEHITSNGSCLKLFKKNQKHLYWLIDRSIDLFV